MTAHSKQGPLRKIRLWIAWKFLPISKREAEKRLEKAHVSAEEIPQSDPLLKGRVKMQLSSVENCLGIYPTYPLGTETDRESEVGE